MTPRACFYTMMAIFIFLSVAANVCHGQVTFSRDWNAGKRGIIENPDLHISLKSAATVCRLLINQIRQASACESVRNEHNDGDPIPMGQMFAGKR